MYAERMILEVNTSLYLPEEKYIPVNTSTKEGIKKIIKQENEKVCKALKSFEML